jgi:hypothetical protein
VNELRRILEEEGYERAKDLLRAEPGEDPPAGAADRVLAAMGIGGVALAASPPKAGFASTAASKWLVIALVGGAVAVGGMIARRPAPLASKPVEAPVEAPAVEVPPEGAPAAVPAESRSEAAPEAEPAPKASAARRAPRAPSDPNEALKAEIGFLDGARAALAAGQPGRALAIVDDYGQRFPHGHFEPEAFVVRLDALVRSGDGERAQRLARDYLATHPNTPHAPRIRRVLEAVERR